jgi:hypothetical protein
MLVCGRLTVSQQAHESMCFHAFVVISHERRISSDISCEGPRQAVFLVMDDVALYPSQRVPVKNTAGKGIAIFFVSVHMAKAVSERQMGARASVNAAGSAPRSLMVWVAVILDPLVMKGAESLCPMGSVALGNRASSARPVGYLEWIAIFLRAAVVFVAPSMSGGWLVTPFNAANLYTGLSHDDSSQSDWLEPASDGRPV